MVEYFETYIYSAGAMAIVVLTIEVCAASSLFYLLSLQTIETQLGTGALLKRLVQKQPNFYPGYGYIVVTPNTGLC